jgi:hypothetical protein
VRNACAQKAHQSSERWAEVVGVYFFLLPPLLIVILPPPPLPFLAIQSSCSHQVVDW